MREMRPEMRGDIIGGGEGRRLSAEELINRAGDKRNIEARFTSGGGGDEYERYLDFLRILTAETKTKKEASQAGTQLGQVGVEVREFRQDGSKRAEGRRVLTEISKIRPEDRTGEDWENLRTEFQNTFGKSLDVDAVANVAYTRAEEEKVQAAAKATVTTQNAGPEQVKVVEPEKKYDNDQVVKNVGLLLRERQRGEDQNVVQQLRKLAAEALKNQGVAVPESLLDPTNRRVSQADAASFLFDLKIVVDDSFRKEVPQLIPDAEARLEKRGIKVSELYAKRTDITANALARRESVQQDPDNFISSLATLPDDQKLRLLSSQSTRAFRAGQDIARYTAEIRQIQERMANAEILDTDPSLRNGGEPTESYSSLSLLEQQLHLPLPGGTYMAQKNNPVYGGLMGVEVAAVSEGRYMDVDKIVSLSLQELGESMSKMFGESIDFSRVGEDIGKILGKLENLSKGIKQSSVAVQSAMDKFSDERGHELFEKALIKAFPSLKPRDGDPLKTRELYDYFIANGYKPADPRLDEIPEMRIRLKIDELLSHQVANQEQLTVLKMIRAKSQNLQDMAELIIPLPAEKIADLWRFGKPIEGRDTLINAEIQSVETYEDRILRLYWAISRISRLRPGETLTAEDKKFIPLGFEELVRKHLTHETSYVTADTQELKKESFVMNRFGLVPDEKERKFNTFVKLAARMNILDLLRNGGSEVAIPILENQLKIELNTDRVVLEKRGAKTSGVDAILAFAEARARMDALTFGIAEAGAATSVTRNVKQEHSEWKVDDAKKALLYGNLYVRGNNGVLMPAVETDLTGDIGKLSIVERKVPGYPNSSIMVEVSNVGSKLEDNILITSNPGSPFLEYVAQRELWPESFNANFFERTTVIRDGVQKTLWDMWASGSSLSEIGKEMMGGEGGETADVLEANNDLNNATENANEQMTPRGAYTNWLKHRKWATKMYELMITTKQEDYTGLFAAGGGTLKKFKTAMALGLNLRGLSREEQTRLKSILKTCFMLNMYLTFNGYTRDTKGAAAQKSQESFSTTGSEPRSNRLEVLGWIIDKSLGETDELGASLAKSALIRFSADKFNVSPSIHSNPNPGQETFFVSVFDAIKPMFKEAPLWVPVKQTTKKKATDFLKNTFRI